MRILFRLKQGGQGYFLRPSKKVNDTFLGCEKGLRLLSHSELEGEDTFQTETGRPRILSQTVQES